MLSFVLWAYKLLRQRADENTSGFVVQIHSIARFSNTKTDIYTTSRTHTHKKFYLFRLSEKTLYTYVYMYVICLIESWWAHGMKWICKITAEQSKAKQNIYTNKNHFYRIAFHWQVIAFSGAVVVCATMTMIIMFSILFNLAQLGTVNIFYCYCSIVAMRIIALLLLLLFNFHPVIRWIEYVVSVDSLSSS